MTVLRYAPPRRRYRTPVVVVPALIGRPAILDLHPRASFLRYLAARGFEVYLLDWGVPGDEDCDIGLDTLVCEALPRVLDRVAEYAQTRDAALLGYCMGGTLAAAHAARTALAAPSALVTLAAPIDFALGGRLARWCAADVLDLDRLLSIFPNVPAVMVEAAFVMLRPTAKLRALLSAGEANGDAALVHAAIERWSSTWLPFPGRAAREWITWLYRENRLLAGTLELGAAPVRLDAIAAPLLVVTAAADEITPPGCARALVERAGSPDKTLLELPGGHIGMVAGRQAAERLWPAVAEWLGARSAKYAG